MIDNFPNPIRRNQQANPKLIDDMLDFIVDCLQTTYRMGQKTAQNFIHRNWSRENSALTNFSDQINN